MQAFETYVEKSMNFWRVPGCSVAIAKEGKILLAKGFGKKRLSENSDHNRVDDETLFPIASITKLFTAAQVDSLVKQNRIKWDDPITAYFPEFKLSDSYAKSHLSFRDCLSMHSGLPGLSANSLWFNEKASRDELLAKLPLLPFKNGFRGSFAYQNLLYLLVAKAVENQQSLSWEESVKKEFLIPLQMVRSDSSFSFFKNDTNKAYPHQGEVKEVPYENLDNLAPAAGIISCAKDMAKWLSMLTRKPSDWHSVFTSQCVVAPEGFFPEHELQLSSVFFPDNQFLTYGFGCFIHNYKGMIVCQTPGLSDGFSTLMLYVPQHDLSIVVLSNLEAPYFPHSVAFHLVDTYLGSNQDWNRIFFEIHQKLTK